MSSTAGLPCRRSRTARLVVATAHAGRAEERRDRASRKLVYAARTQLGLGVAVAFSWSSPETARHRLLRLPETRVVSRVAGRVGPRGLTERCLEANGFVVDRAGCSGRLRGRARQAVGPIGRLDRGGGAPVKFGVLSSHVPNQQKMAKAR